MKESNDISGLFAFFNQKQEGKYQEINKSHSLDAARERWPIFKEVSLSSRTHTHRDREAPVQVESPRNSGAPRLEIAIPKAAESSPVPARGPLFSNRRETLRVDAPREDKARINTPSSNTPALGTLFGRISRQAGSSPLFSQPVKPQAQSESAPRSMQSLFNRLRQS